MIPKISIVTPTFNQGDYIEETICSILDQNYPALEYTIIDGGSSDQTVSIIKKYQRHLKYWISEKDRGQAHAINKGLQHSTGEIFNWLNSDDYLEPGALATIAHSFSSGADMVGGKVRLFEQDQTLKWVQHSQLSAKGLMYWLNGVQFVQPGVWMRRALLEQAGGIDERLHYAFDWDLYIRYLSLFPNVAYTDQTLVHFRYHDQSKTVTLQEKFQQEEQKIIEKLAHLEENPTLKKLARYKLAGQRITPSLNTLITNHNESKIRRLQRLFLGINQDHFTHWRATLGAIRRILMP